MLAERPGLQKLGILGGTFNPIHYGHIQLAKTMIAAAGLDLLVLMPTGRPPHKAAPQLAPARERLEMCRIAARSIPRCCVSDMEIRRGGKSYTVDTLRALKRAAPTAELYLIMGADMFLTIGDWRQPEEILSLCIPCAAPRDQATAETLRAYARQMGMKEFLIVPMPPFPVSSTAIRENLRLGLPATGMLPQEVEAYLGRQQLYKEGTGLTQEQMLEIVKEKTSQPRYRHTLCVMRAAQALARKYGGDPEKAAAAGILHDIMKDEPAAVQLQTLEESAIILSAVERAEPKLWHAMAGSVFIRDTLKIQDTELLDAVRYHTTARANMTLLDKILYVADYISDDRTFDGVERLREIAAQDLDRAVFEGVKYSITDLAGRERFLHPDSVNAYNEYLIKSAKA